MHGYFLCQICARNLALLAHIPNVPSFLAHIFSSNEKQAFWSYDLDRPITEAEFRLSQIVLGIVSNKRYVILVSGYVISFRIWGREEVTEVIQSSLGENHFCCLFYHKINISLSIAAQWAASAAHFELPEIQKNWIFIWWTLDDLSDLFATSDSKTNCRFKYENDISFIWHYF